MSRIGKQPVSIPSGVTASVSAEAIGVKGPKGELSQTIVPGVKVTVDDAAKEIRVDRESDQKEHRALHGLYRSLINNMVIGVTEGYSRRMTIVGTGYRVELSGQQLNIQAGFGHPVSFVAPEGVTIEVPKATSREKMDFIVSGIDKQKVGEAAAQLRRIRPPDLYKGKGIRYADETPRRLEGKSFSSG